MIKHWQSLTDAESKGLLETCLNQDCIQTAALVCDMLYVNMRFQKLLQADHITIDSLRDHCIPELSKLLDWALPGGYEKLETCARTTEGDV